MPGSKPQGGSYHEKNIGNDSRRGSHGAGARGIQTQTRASEKKRPSKAPPPQKRYSMLSRICASTRTKSRRRRKTPKISRRLFAVSSTTANIPYPALCGKSARLIRRPRNDTPPEIQPPEMAVRVRLPEMRQHSRGTRPAQGQRRRLLYPVYRAHGQPPPEPDTRRRKRARPPLRVLYAYPGGRGGEK